MAAASDWVPGAPSRAFPLLGRSEASLCNFVVGSLLCELGSLAPPPDSHKWPDTWDGSTHPFSPGQSPTNVQAPEWA